jgi:hypothetical protein
LPRITRIVAALDPQEAGGQLEGLRPEARHGLQRTARAKRTLCVAMRNDPGRHRVAEPRDLGQQGG